MSVVESGFYSYLLMMWNFVKCDRFQNISVKESVVNTHRGGGDIDELNYYFKGVITINKNGVCFLTCLNRY